MPGRTASRGHRRTPLMPLRGRAPTAVPSRAVLGLIGVLVVLAGAPTAAQQPEGFGIRLGQVPADRAEDPRALSYIIDHVPPGTTLERHIEVVNGDDVPAEVEVYPVSAEIVGDAFVPDAGRATNELAGWVTVTPAQLVVPPDGRATVTVRIDVPTDATAGERYAVVLAERAVPDALPPGEVGVAARVGVRIYLSVGEGAEPRTDFQITSLTAVTREDGVRAVRAVVTNTGGRALDFTGELTLSDGPGGLSAGPFEVTRGTTLAPGEEVALEVPLDARIPAGEWQADLRLVSGTLVRQVQARLTFTEDVGVGEPQPVTRAGGNALLPLLAGLVALLLVGGAGWLLASRRRRASEEPAADQSPGATDEVPGITTPPPPPSPPAWPWAPPEITRGRRPADGSPVPPPSGTAAAPGPVAVPPPPPPGPTAVDPPAGPKAVTPPRRSPQGGPWPPPGGGA